MDGILNDKSFLRKIFNHATSIIIVLDEYKNIIDFNSTALKYLGISINNLTEMSFSNIVLEDDKDRINKCIDGIFDNTFDKPCEFFVQRKDGSIGLLEMNHFLHIVDDTSEDDPVHGYYADKYLVLYGNDVSEKRALQEGEKIEREKFETLFNNSGVGMAMIDLDLRYIDVNKTFCEMLQYDYDEVMKMTPKDLIYEDDSSIIDDVCNRLLYDKEENVQIEKQYKKKDSFVMWSYTTVTLHRTKDGKPLYYLATIQDISEKKYYEEKARENEKKYRLLFTRSFNAIAYKKLVFDRKGSVADYIILDANSAYERATGLKRNEIIGRPMRSKAQEHFKVSLDENMERLRHYELLVKEGKDVHLKDQMSRTFDRPIDVYYYILDSAEGILAVVFGDIDEDENLVIQP